MSSVNEISTWSPHEKIRRKARKVWFTKDPGFDQTIQPASWLTTQEAAAGKLELALAEAIPGLCRAVLLLISFGIR